MYSNNIVNFQESTSILNACTKKSGNLLKARRRLILECSLLSFSHFWHKVINKKCPFGIEPKNSLAQSAGAVEYTDCTSAEG